MHLKNFSTKMLLDSKIRRWGAPSIHFEEPLKNKKHLWCQPAERKEEEREGMEMSAESTREGPGEGEQKPKRLRNGGLKSDVEPYR